MKVSLKSNNFSKLTAHLDNKQQVLPKVRRYILEKHGIEGVAKLREATPKDTGLTADSWDYISTATTLTFTNSNIEDSFVVVSGIRFGHATSGGTYVQGYDFVTPILKEVFEGVVKDLTKEIKRR